jgi:hypothetical protein
MPTVTDSFTRANETPMASPWTLPAGGLGEVADACEIYSVGVTFGADQSSKGKLTCVGTGGSAQGIGLAVRRSAAVQTMYRFVIDHAATSNAVIVRFVTGTATTLVTWTQAFTDGDTFELKVTGPQTASKLEVFRNGVSVQTFTDSSTVASGFPGLGSSSAFTSGSVDDWVGTDQFTAPAPLDPQIQWTDDFGPGDFGPNPFTDTSEFLTGPDAAPAVTTLSDADSGTGTDAGTVSATVPGADTAAGADAGTVAATLPGSDSATGTDTAAVSATVPGSDSAAGTDAGTATATGSGSDTGTGTDAGGVAATLAGSDSATGTDAQVSIVSPVSGSDSATGTDDAAASVAAPGADSGTGTESSVATATDPGGEAGAGFDAGTISATVPGSDSGTGTDAGTVEDVTAGPTLVSGSDSGAAADAGLVVDVTPAPVPVEDEDLGDISTEDRRRKTGHDSGRSEERAWVVDLTPRPRLEPPRVLLPARKVFLRLRDHDGGAAAETGSILVLASGAESGRAVERDRGETLGVLDPAVEAEDEAMALRLLGVDL